MLKSGDENHSDRTKVRHHRDRSRDESRSRSHHSMRRSKSRDRDRHRYSRNRDDDRSRSYNSRRSRSRDRYVSFRYRGRYRRSRSRNRNRSRSRSYESRRRDRYSRDSRRRRSRSRSNDSQFSMSGFRTRSNSPGSDSNTETKQEVSTEKQNVSTIDESSREQPQITSTESTQAAPGTNEVSNDSYDLSNIMVDGKYIGEVQTEEQRKLIHEQMKKKLEMMSYNAPEHKAPFLPALLPQITPNLGPSVAPFANDGSFLERFKLMQQQFEVQQQMAPYYAAETMGQTGILFQSTSSNPPAPLVGRRRGGKILKTGVVEKPKKRNADQDPPSDAWALYLREVQRYKSVVCDDDTGRPLVK